MNELPKSAPPGAEKHESRAEKRRDMRRMLDYSVIGLVFPVAMILGFLAGQWLGGLAGRDKLGGVVGGLLGIAAGFYNVYKMTVKLGRDDAPPGPDA